jgi:hypothetical protein
MISPQVFSVWISTSSSLELERESQQESTPEENSANSKELQLMKPDNGSPRNAPEPSFEKKYQIFTIWKNVSILLKFFI